MVSKPVIESHDLAIGRVNLLEVERYPEGWARLAAEQDESVNIAIHRKFSYLGNRCLLYYEQKITRMEDQLLELDWQIANGEGVQGQPNQPPVQSHEEPDPRNQKIEAIFENLARYRKLILSKFPNCIFFANKSRTGIAQREGYSSALRSRRRGTQVKVRQSSERWLSWSR